MIEPVTEPLVEEPAVDTSPLRRDGQAATLIRLADGVITETLHAPTGPGWDNDSSRWIDWGDQAVFDAWCAECGWTVVAETPEPEAGDRVAVSTIELLEGIPTRVWSMRDKTPAELDVELATQAAAQRDALVQQRIQALPDGIPAIQTTQDAIVDALAASMGVTL